MFNECLFHLCDCTCTNVMCILNFLMIKYKNIFEYFICFWKCFYVFVCSEFFQTVNFFLVEKLFQKHFHEYESTHENEEAIFSIFWNLHREFRNCFTSRSYPRNLSRCFRGHFTSNFTRNLPKKWAVLQFLKSNSDSFSNISILPPPHLSKPKTPFPSKSHPKLKINHS